MRFLAVSCPRPGRKCWASGPAALFSGKCSDTPPSLSWCFQHLIQRKGSRAGEASTSQGGGDSARATELGAEALGGREGPLLYSPGPGLSSQGLGVQAEHKEKNRGDGPTVIQGMM